MELTQEARIHLSLSVAIAILRRMPVRRDGAGLLRQGSIVGGSYEPLI